MALALPARLVEAADRQDLRTGSPGPGMDGAELLLDAGVDIDSQDSEALTALMWAASMGPVESVRSLMEAGADPSLRCQTGETAAEYARLRTDGKTDEIIKLLQLGASLTPDA